MFKKELPIIFIGLSIVAATLVLSWIISIKLMPAVPVQAPVVDDEEIVADNNISEIDISSWKTYRNEELGLEFKYPEEWGSLFESEEDFPDTNAFHPSRIRVSISNLKDNPVILEVDNGEDRMGRGKFTGDIVIDVNSQDYIENFCQNQKDKNISKCEHKVNSNNISFVKYEDELCSEGGCFGKGLFYLIYNSNSEYRGILLYTYNIQEDKIIVDHKEEMIFDSLIDNLKFNK